MDALRLTALHTPRGARDILPQEAAQKAIVEERLASLFASWAYLPVDTPTLEYFDCLSVGNGSDIESQTYRFLERDGSTLALRPEVTTPIARLVSTRLRDKARPLRLRYLSRVFRYDQPQAGRQREFTQAGVELLGASGSRADAEIVALAVEAMRACGLEDFRVDIGHAGFFGGILESAGIDPETQGVLRAALLNRDFVGLESLIGATGVSAAAADALLALTDLRGGQETLARGASLAPNPVSQAALTDLGEVFSLLEKHGVSDQVSIDLGLVKDYTYYTGLVFEGYTREVGFTLCTGGRYDGLLGRFGCDCPATGFALGVDRTLLALERQGHLPTVTACADVQIGAGADRFLEALRLAETLRSWGYSVAVDEGTTGVARVTVKLGFAGAAAELDGVGGHSVCRAQGARAIGEWLRVELANRLGGAVGGAL